MESWAVARAEYPIGNPVLLHSGSTKNLSQNRWGLAHFAESSEQNVPVPFSAPRAVLG